MSTAAPQGWLLPLILARGAALRDAGVPHGGLARGHHRLKQLVIPAGGRRALLQVVDFPRGLLLVDPMEIS